MNILVINSGSSSVKYQLIDMSSEIALTNGVVERIGEVESLLVHRWCETDGHWHEIRRSEQVAFRTYEWRCKLAFEPSFLAGRLFRQAVRTPALDWLIRVGERPEVRSATARLMAAM